MTIAEEYKKALTHVRRVAGAYKRYGAEFGDILEPVKRPTRGSIRRLAEIEREIRVIGEQAVREQKKSELIQKAEIAKDNFIHMIDSITNQGKKATTRTMVESSRAFLKITMENMFDDMKKSGTTYDIKGYINALESQSQDLKGTMDRLVNAIYDEELNDEHSTSEENSNRYIRLANNTLRALGGLRNAKLTIADLPWQF